MREFSVEEKLKKDILKLYKKDRGTYNILINKMEEVINCKNVDHYKNLRKPLQYLKRIHIRGTFILTFKYIVSEDKIIFYDFDDHDHIYL